ncbi:MAG: BlaI/MecI/CopY family transcriptional regulator [Planctomycetota bacterium]
MARTPREVTDAELAVLEVLWVSGRRTARELAETLYPDEGRSQVPTVQKLCERLEIKGFVSRDRRVRPHEFEAALDRGEVIERQLRAVADKLCEGSLTPLLTQLVRGSTLKASQRRQLRRILDDLDREDRGR